MKFIEHLDHVCVRGALLNVHRPPQLFICGNGDCGQGERGEHKFHLSKEMAVKAGVDVANPKCPKCSGPLEPSEPNHFADLHLELCLDERIHYPEWHRKKKISDEQFQQWKASLTERELNGHFEVQVHHLAIKLTAEEVDQYDADPEACINSLMPKIAARLELDAQFQIQHRHKVTQHEVKHLFKNDHFLASLKSS